MFEKLAQKLNITKKREYSTPVVDRMFLNKLSKTALSLYEKQCDIKYFSKMVMDNLDDISGMDELFKNGIIDPFEDEKLEQLADNSRFLRDLGLTD
ncbi:MAG: hypothetical protein LBK53_09110 [Heliobacteriaceae bacterium]|jgi:hypothetical protein|nr:hypothetical protein [Heliobacteriaceae bacterium]